MSIREAARRVGRDVKGVHGDVTALIAAGLLERVQGGVEFPFDAVKVEFVLQPVSSTRAVARSPRTLAS